MKKIEKLLKSIFLSHKEIKLVYFFGSMAEGNGGPRSDWDFAFYLEEKDKKKIFKIKFQLMDEIGRALKTDKIDVIILNIVENLELKYEVIKNGQLIYEKEPYKVLIEPRILQEYFDYQIMMRKYNLTKS